MALSLAQDPFRWDEERLPCRIPAEGCSRFLVVMLSVHPGDWEHTRLHAGVDGPTRRRWSTMPCMDSVDWRMLVWDQTGIRFAARIFSDCTMSEATQKLARCVAQIHLAPGKGAFLSGSSPQRVAP